MFSSLIMLLAFRIVVSSVSVLCCSSVFAEHPVGGHRSQSLHRYSGMLSNNCQRFLADGLAGKHTCDRHDNERG